MPVDDDFDRFRNQTKILVDGKETYGQWTPMPFLVTRPDAKFIRILKITTSYEGKPDLISEFIYGTPLLYWVLLAFNNVREPLGWPRAGDVIEYPIDEVVLPQIL